ncbi:UNVERIFIED_CONTAM: hypothetical protein Sangu_0291700 [Sesamum angustifolium]|uniref:Uncharacterized protein n=1 Tax=Sesamum angustifolium TaxID=2727405 RepID=A0AAW2QPP7_9LAMI
MDFPTLMTTTPQTSKASSHSQTPQPSPPTQHSHHLRYTSPLSPSRRARLPVSIEVRARPHEQRVQQLRWLSQFNN